MVKANLTIMISDELIKSNGLHAGKIIKEIAKKIMEVVADNLILLLPEVKNPNGIQAAFEMAKKIIQ